jgi:hypothetical protein
MIPPPTALDHPAPEALTGLFSGALPERTLVATCRAGLCNRLKVLLSGLALAADSGRAFVMLWPRTPSCSAAYDELLANPYPVVTPTDDFPIQSLLDELGSPPGSLRQMLFSPRPHLMVHSYTWLARPADARERAAYWSRMAALMDGLAPIADIAARIEDFRARHFAPVMIGVHLRRGDYLTHRPQSSRNTEGALLAVDHFLRAAPQAGILLCTDDGAVIPRTGQSTPLEGIQAIFQARYGDRVVRQAPRSLDRRTPEAIQDALADLWLLRSTDYFVGTLDSTFSVLATVGRNVPRFLCAEMTPADRRAGALVQAVGLGWLVRWMIRARIGYDLPFPLAWQWCLRACRTAIGKLSAARRRQ